MFLVSEGCYAFFCMQFHPRFSGMSHYGSEPFINKESYKNTCRFVNNTKLLFTVYLFTSKVLKSLSEVEYHRTRSSLMKSLKSSVNFCLTLSLCQPPFVIHSSSVLHCFKYFASGSYYFSSMNLMTPCPKRRSIS